MEWILEMSTKLFKKKKKSGPLIITIYTATLPLLSYRTQLHRKLPPPFTTTTTASSAATISFYSLNSTTLTC